MFRAGSESADEHGDRGSEAANVAHTHTHTHTPSTHDSQRNSPWACAASAREPGQSALVSKHGRSTSGIRGASKHWLEDQ
eukprot:1915837-Alexandrium_andersonii.AAC.1